MLCAGVTTYAALRKSKAISGQWVVISGAGGGLGHIACQLASGGMALRVIGIDAPSKKNVVMSCGAEYFIDVTAHDDTSIVAEVLRLTVRDPCYPLDFISRTEIGLRNFHSLDIL